MMQPCPFKRKRTVQALKNVAFLKKIKNSTLCIIILLKKDIYNVTKEFYFKLMLFSDLFYSSNILKKKKVSQFPQGNGHFSRNTTKALFGSHLTLVFGEF